MGLHGLCWIHAERLVKKLTAGSADRIQLQKQARAAIWTLYRSPKRYRPRPTPGHAAAIRKRFKTVFGTVTGWPALDELMQRLGGRPYELLLALKRPAAHEPERGRHPNLS